MSLTFDQLRAANIARLPEFKNSKGDLAHSQPDGSDWNPGQWLQALVGEIGEIGEYANIRKKYERGDIGMIEFEALAAKELADVQTYLDILARRCLDYVEDGRVVVANPVGVDLGKATRLKFNEVSRRVGSNVWLTGKDGEAGVYVSTDEVDRATCAYHSDPTNLHPCYD